MKEQPAGAAGEQEWKPIFTQQVGLPDRTSFECSSKAHRDKAIAAHNAALVARDKQWERQTESLEETLVAEREKLKLYEQNPELTKVVDELVQLRTELADTWEVLCQFDHTGKKEPLSECAGVAVEAYKNLEHQLAAAQARLANAQAIVLRIAPNHPDLLGTAALDAAITAAQRPLCKRIEELCDAQQPLVDALELIAEPGHSGLDELRAIARNALTKVEKK